MAHNFLLCKARLKWVIRNTGDGKPSSFTKQMIAHGWWHNEKTLRRYYDLDIPTLPQIDDLLIIHAVRPDLAVMWFLGLTPPLTDLEIGLERQAVDEVDAFLKTRRAIHTAAASLAVVAFIVGSIACASSRYDHAQHFEEWCKIVTIEQRAISIEDYERHNVEEMIVIGRIGRVWRGGVSNNFPRCPSVNLKMRGKWK